MRQLLRGMAAAAVCAKNYAFLTRLRSDATYSVGMKRSSLSYSGQDFSRSPPLSGSRNLRVPLPGFTGSPSRQRMLRAVTEVHNNKDWP
jgi:hypothetical protein